MEIAWIGLYKTVRNEEIRCGDSLWRESTNGLDVWHKCLFFVVY